MRNISILSILIIGLFLAACGGGPAANNGSANNAAPKNANNNGNSSNGNLPPDTIAKPVAPTENNAPTLGPVVQAYYDGLKAKNEAAVKAVMAPDFIKATEDGMKDEKVKDFVTYLTSYDKVPDKPMEVRNEKINGNQGTVEIKGGTYINWFVMVLVNDGGKWKLTNKSPDIDNVKSQDTTGK